MLLADTIESIPECPGVYVLCGRNGTRYTGAARLLRTRLRDHLAGRGKRTKNQRPLSLVHCEVCTTFSDALARERYLKSGAGREWLTTHQTVSPQASPPWREI